MVNTNLKAAEDGDSMPVAIATVIQVQAPTSAKPGDRALLGSNGLLHGWVGGGCVQPAVLKISKHVLQTGQPTLLRVAPDGTWEPVDGLTDYSSNCLGRGSLLLFIEPMHTQPTLCVLGHSAVALSLASLALSVKLNVILQAPGAQKDSVSPRIDFRPQYEIVNADYIVIATQGSGDKHAIANALVCHSEHISMVVSERKLEALKIKMLEDGFKQCDIDKLNGQAGLRIGAQLPEEIALSVLAEIVQIRRSAGNAQNATNNATAAIPVAAKKSDDRDSSEDEGNCCGG